MSLDEDERLAGPARHERITEYIAGGLDFYNDWNVWVALDTYLQLKERFGWDFYKTIFANYLALSEAALPLTDQARIDLWVIQSSEVAQHDLSDFYLAWGFPHHPKCFGCSGSFTRLVRSPYARLLDKNFCRGALYLLL